MRLRIIAPLLLASVAAGSLPAQIYTLSRDQLVKMTAENPYDRFPDGRPKVPDAVLEKCKGLSIEEVWAVLPGKGYKWQFAGTSLKIMHPEKKLIGRAVTAQFLPMRPDLAKLANPDTGGPRLSPHQRLLIDNLQQGDVPVVDLFGKIEGGTIVGDNLATAIFNATHTGLIVDGAIRDLEGIFPINMPVYYRGVHPSALDYQQVTLTGLNVPVKIGDATVMPGDVVFGDRGGLYFIPPALIKEILDRADVTHIHDEWTKIKLDTGKYKSSEIYPSPHDPALKKEYEEYLKAHLGK
ncbi:MAG TPA: dimethylmenaquinone methyltransferase [Bryobacteraceae bacterium]|jgi:regulator of RNase E activity RraA